MGGGDGRITDLGRAGRIQLSALLIVRPFEGRRLRQHPVPQIEPEAWHPQIADEPWESQIERASVPSPVFAPRQNQPTPGNG